MFIFKFRFRPNFSCYRGIKRRGSRKSPPHTSKYHTVLTDIKQASVYHAYDILTGLWDQIMFSSYPKSVVLLAASTVSLGLFWLGYTYFYDRRKKPIYRAGVVTALYIYPVKSCAGIKISKMEVEKVGPAFDRHWVLLNAKGIYIAQTRIPKMALIQPSFEGTQYLCLNAPGMPTLKLNLEAEDIGKERRMFEILGILGEGLYCGDEVSQWFQTFLEKPGLYLYSGRNENLKRRHLITDKVWGDMTKEGDQCVFSNVSPVMVLSSASLSAFNCHLKDPVTMRSFRPSVVISGCGSYEEDSWHTILIGDVLLRRARLAHRCPLTCVNPDTGTMRPDKEPLKTLKRVRQPPEEGKRSDSPLFGVHFVVDQIGTINIGDEVLVLK